MNVSRLELVAQFAPSGKQAVTTPAVRPLPRLPRWRAIWLRTCIPTLLPAQGALLRLVSASLLHCRFYSAGTSVKNIAHWAQAIRKSREREHPLFQM